MEIPLQAAVLGLACTGTLAIYNLDRLRDLPRDRLTAPERSAFVERHARPLTASTVVAAAASLVLGVAAGWRVIAVAAGVMVFGLAHRRLKQRPWVKPLYLTLSWSAVVVGLPIAADPGAHNVLWVAGIVALTVQANVTLSNLRDDEGAAAQLGRRRALLVAAGLLLVAALLSLTGAPSLRPLIWLPAAMGAAVAAFRPGERYGLIVVDGALLAGALLALLGSRVSS